MRGLISEWVGCALRGRRPTSNPPTLSLASVLGFLHRDGVRDCALSCWGWSVGIVSREDGARSVAKVSKRVEFPEWSTSILELRRQLGLTQSELGSRLHYSAMAVCRWETGKQEPTSQCYIQLGNLAAEPGCWFFGGTRRTVTRARLGSYFGGAATDGDLMVLSGSAKTSTALPDFGWRISGANSDGIRVDQLPPPVPAGMAMYCFPLARYVIGNPCGEVSRRDCQRILPLAASYAYM